MAVALRSQSSLSLANRTNSTLTAPSGIVNGDLLVAFVVAGDGNDQTAPTVTAPAGFSAITGSPFTISRADPYAIGLNIFVKVASGESGNYTFTHGAADSEGHMLCYSGVDTTTPVSPNATSNTGTGTAVTATGLTTAANDSAVIYSVLLWDGATSTPPTGTTPTFTERHDLGSSGVLYIADGILATAGATGNKTGTFSLQGSSNPWRAVLLSLKAATGGGGSQNIDGALYSDADTFFGATVGRGAVNIAGALFTDSDAFYAATVSAGDAAISGSLFLNANSFYGASLSASYSIAGALFTDSDSFPSATVTASYTVSGALFSDPDAFYAATVTTTYSITGALYTDPDQFFASTVVPEGGNQEIAGELFSDPDQFFGAVVSSGQLQRGAWGGTAYRQTKRQRDAQLRAIEAAIRAEAEHIELLGQAYDKAHGVAAAAFEAMGLDAPAIMPRPVAEAAERVPLMRSPRARARVLDLVAAIKEYQQAKAAEDEEILVLLLAA